MRKLYPTLAILAAAALALPAAAQAQTKIVIGIPTSPPNIVHMPAIVAADLGLYKKAGLDVEIVSLGDGTKVYRALLAEIKTLADLKGKRIGIQEPGGFADILSRSVLRAAKIDPKDVNFVSIA